MRKLRLRSAQEKLKMQKRARVQYALLQRELNNIEGEDPLWDLQVKEFDQAVDTSVEVLKETYINNILYVQDRMKDNAEEDELKKIEDIILSTEKLIIYFEQSDEWVKNLHEEARKNSGIEGEVDEVAKDNDTEADRIEEARNS